MKIKFILLLLTFSVIFSFSSLHSDTLWQQIPDTLNALGYACQEDSLTLYDAEIVDDIILYNYDWEIDSIISWWVGWGGFLNWSYVENINLRIYQDSMADTFHYPVDSAYIHVTIDSSQFRVDTIISQAKYRLTINLDSSLFLSCNTPNNLYWLEIQPINPFNTNGKTGWMADPDIGNQRCFYMRFPLIHTYTWTSAINLWGDNSEVGLIVFGDKTLNAIEENQSENILNEPCFILRQINQVELRLNLKNSVNTSVSIYDLTGRLSFEEHFGILQSGENILSINLENLNQGIYFLKLNLGNQYRNYKINII